MRARGNRKRLTGTVLSDRMEKTVMVQIKRRESHPFYGKVVNRRKKFMAHNPENRAQKGDQVMIEETRPLSRRKRWQVKKILKKGAVAEPLPGTESEEVEGVQ